ncbi:MAG: FkbM family methyltransferase [Saprospiraceae bacterium]|nr:FkbM family methyltransferase [Saprospiraceae bacterium]
MVFKIFKHILNVIPLEIKQLTKRLFLQKDPFSAIRKIPRYQEANISIGKARIRIADNASFFFMYHEIFEKEIYKFQSDRPDPLIIDGGANIGLATLYLKQLYPKARIIAFEPDPYIFSLLKTNISENQLSEVELVNKGLWIEDKTLSFWSEGADGGRVSAEGGINIPVVSLRPYLNEPVALLKLDIEGAEEEVLECIKDDLGKVMRVFVEYHSFLDRPQAIGRIIEILQDAGFRLQINSPGLSTQTPFLSINTYAGMDMQLNIWGFR